jgi:hypothetical protein
VLIIRKIVLGSFVIYLDSKLQSLFGDGIVQATIVIATLWPLVFSAIIGSMMKTIAHQKLQRGSTIDVRAENRYELTNSCAAD